MTDPSNRWTAAIVLGFSDRGPQGLEKAWTIEGALALAETLPEGLSDLRDDLAEKFSARAAGWLGDALTPPTH